VEYEAIQAFFTVVLAICGGIVCIAGACAAVVKFWRWAHKTSDKNAEDIDSFRSWLASDKRRIEEIEKRQDETEQMNKLQLKALFTLLGHEIDGNHTDQLAKVRREINEYLIAK